jgi:arylformamidase
VPSFPEPRITRFQSMPDDPLNVTNIDMVVHVGTHLDAPAHFIPDGPTISDIPVDRLVGPGVVWHLEGVAGGTIDQADLAAATPSVRAGEMVLLDTGWADRWGTPEYHDSPSLTVGAAEWLVKRGVTLLGVDFPTPDLAPHRRGPDFDWPVHQVLLRNGVLIVEHLAELATVAGQRVDVFVGALLIRDADGAPARVLARPVERREEQE